MSDAGCSFVLVVLRSQVDRLIGAAALDPVELRWLPGRLVLQATRGRAWIAKSVAALVICFAFPANGWAWARDPEPAPIQGEFDNEDPVSLARGSQIPTECEHHLRIGEKTYCFESDSSLTEFQNDPSLLLKAQAFWSKNHAP